MTRTDLGIHVLRSAGLPVAVFDVADCAGVQPC
jgi:hypothetical protein